MSITQEYRNGHAEQMSWLRGKPVSTARLALAARRATQEGNDYNRGATAATSAYIATFGRAN